MKIVVIENRLDGGRYVEPYAGGAAVALSLLFDELVESVHINDINVGVYSFWKSVVEDTDDLCRRIRSARLNLAEWNRQKCTLADASASRVERAFATFYMNRTNRSGIIDGGVIGGLDQSSEWGIDARFDRAALAARVERVARYGSRIRVSRKDAVELLSRDYGKAGPEVFAYIDPPYYVKGRGLYEHSYVHDDHVRVAGVTRSLRCRWVVSYDATPEVLDLYRDRERLVYGLSYSAAVRYRGKEVIVFGPGVKPPRRLTAANVHTTDVNRVRAEMWKLTRTVSTRRRQASVE